MAQLGRAIGSRRQQRAAQGPDDLAMHHHRHMQPRPQAMVKDRPMPRPRRIEPGVRAGVGGQHVIDLAHQERPDRAVCHRAQGIPAPPGLDAAFIGCVEPPVALQDADVQMVMRQDLCHLGCHRLDGRAEIQLPRQQARDREEPVDQFARGRLHAPSPFPLHHARSPRRRAMSQSAPILRIPAKLLRNPANAVPKPPYPRDPFPFILSLPGGGPGPSEHHTGGTR